MMNNRRRGGTSARLFLVWTVARLATVTGAAPSIFFLVLGVRSVCLL